MLKNYVKGAVCVFYLTLIEIRSAMAAADLL